jgi:hypothetical protein
MALESAAVLVNQLVACLRSAAPSRPSTEDVDTMFEHVQNLRVPRVQKFVEAANKRQALEALLTPELKETAKTRIPKITRETLFRQWVNEFTQALSLSTFPIPVRPRLVPYEDEKRAKRDKTMAKRAIL